MCSSHYTYTLNEIATKLFRNRFFSSKNIDFMTSDCILILNQHTLYDAVSFMGLFKGHALKLDYWNQFPLFGIEG